MAPLVSGDHHDVLRHLTYVEPTCLEYRQASSFSNDAFTSRFESLELCGAVGAHHYRVVSEGGPSLTRVAVQKPTSGAGNWMTVAEYESEITDETGPLVLSEVNGSGITGTADRKSYTGSPTFVTIYPILRHTGGWHFPGSKLRLAAPLPESDDCYLLSFQPWGNEFTFVAEANDQLDVGPNTITIRITNDVIELKKGTESLYLVPPEVFRADTGSGHHVVLKRDGDTLWFQVRDVASGAVPFAPQRYPVWSSTCEGWTRPRTGPEWNQRDECWPTVEQIDVSFSGEVPGGLTDGRHFGVIDCNGGQLRLPATMFVDVEGSNEGLFRQGCANGACEWQRYPPPKVGELVESFEIEFGDGGYWPACLRIPRWRERSKTGFYSRFWGFIDRPPWYMTPQGCPDCFDYAEGAAAAQVVSTWEFDGQEHLVHIEVLFYGPAVDSEGNQIEDSGGGETPGVIDGKQRRYKFTVSLGDGTDPYPDQITLTEQDADEVLDTNPDATFGLAGQVYEGVWPDGEYVDVITNECPSETFTITMSRET